MIRKLLWGWLYVFGMALLVGVWALGGWWLHHNVGLIYALGFTAFAVPTMCVLAYVWAILTLPKAFEL